LSVSNGFNRSIDGSLIDTLLLGQSSSFLGFTLPLGFCHLCELFVKDQAVCIWEMANAIQDFKNGLTHGNTSKLNELAFNKL